MRGLLLPGCDCVPSVYSLLLNPTLHPEGTAETRPGDLCCGPRPQGQRAPDSPAPLVCWSRKFSAPGCQGKQMYGARKILNR